MALCWNTADCKPDTPADDQEAKQLTQLIFLAGMIEAGNLTTDTLREWMVRLSILRKLLASDPSPVIVGDCPENRLAVLTRWIGLRVNVESTPRDEWLARWTQTWVDVAEHGADYAMDGASAGAEI